MLAKRFRLPIQLFVAKKGKLVRTPYFLLKVFSPELGFSPKRASPSGVSRFGVTVSVKTAKKATQRNRLKRMAYNFIREYYKKIPIGDYWISVLPAAVSLSKENFIMELNKTLNPCLPAGRPKP